MNPLTPIILLALAAAAQADLLATFTGPDGSSDTRLDRLPAILVNPGEAAAGFLPPGAFSVTWTGTLILDARSRLNFSFEGEGKAALKIAGEAVLQDEGVLGTATMETLRLNPGEHPVEITFTSKPDGSGRFRLFWEERGFPRQSVPPTVFKSDANPAGDILRRGRELFTDHQCIACHQPAKALGAQAVPELSQRPPLIADIGARVTQEWLTRWISSPTALKHTTTMPAMVNHRSPEGAQQAADIAAFLATLGKPAVAPAPDPALAQKGGEHFHNLGCVACHTLPDQNQQDFANRRIPLNNVAAKYQNGALATFLKNPRAHAPSIKMPDFALAEAEAAALAAFLTTTSTGKHTPDPSEFPPGDATRGQGIVKSLACAACHTDLPPASAPQLAGVPSLEALAGKDWGAAGCLVDDQKAHPHFPQLKDADRAALAAFAMAGLSNLSNLSRHVPSEFAKSQIASHRCTSCHALDGRPALLDSLHPQTNKLVAHLAGHAENVDQTRPQLTFLGEMLHASFIEATLSGKAIPRPRPWLDMRMPAFHQDATLLAAGIAHQHGIVPSDPSARPHLPDTASLAKTGASLVGSQRGFACTICHAIGSEKATAVFEAEGINLDQTKYRLRYEFFHRWLDDPTRVTPGTKMPKYTTDGKSPLTQHLDGDARKQFDALWEYLHTLPQPPSP